MRSHEAAWVAELLILLPEVDVISVAVNDAHVWANPTGRRNLVNAARLDIQASTAADAEVLAKVLNLTEDEPTERDDTRWRYWSGWSANASREVPVTVKVTFVERVASIIPDGIAA